MSITAAILMCLAPVAIDGDTIRCGAGPTSIRMFAIQAPERGTEGHPASTANLNANAQGGVWCQPKGTSYTRIVAVCYNAKGLDLGKAQLDTKNATEWCSYSRNYYGTCP